MLPGDIYVALDNVDAMYAGTEMSHGFRKNPATASNVENVESTQWSDYFIGSAEMLADCLSQIGRAQLIEQMQRPELTVFIPPLVGKLTVIGNFILIDSGPFHRRQARNSARVLCLALKVPPSAVVCVRELESITPRDLTQ